MNVLIYGAGVIGSILAAKLAESGNHVTVLDRGARLKEIKEHGIVLQHGLTGQTMRTSVNITESLGREDSYDLAIVPVRADQLPGILSVLSQNKGIDSILFMVNNPCGYDQITKVLNPQRTLIGFPGMGGGKQGHVVIYNICRPVIQRTTIGELDGQITKRVQEIALLLAKAGLPSAVEKDMDGWQKSHVSWVSPFANAIYMAGGSNYMLARRPDCIKLFIEAAREGFSVVEASGHQVIPAKLKLIKWLPIAVQLYIYRFIFNTREIEILATLHCQSAPEEMKQLSEDFAKLAAYTNVPIPTIKHLAGYIDSFINNNES